MYFHPKKYSLPKHQLSLKRSISKKARSIASITDRHAISARIRTGGREKYSHREGVEIGQRENVEYRGVERGEG